MRTLFSCVEWLEEKSMATTGAKRMTLEDFRALPEGPPYYEYEEGELILVVSPRPNIRTSSVNSRMCSDNLCDSISWEEL
jgi:hypothetical protein